MKCVTFVSETFTRYSSNIANVWQEIFAPMNENPSIFVKVTAKKSVAPFFLGHGVEWVNTRQLQVSRTYNSGRSLHFLTVVCA